MKINTLKLMDLLKSGKVNDRVFEDDEYCLQQSCLKIVLSDDQTIRLYSTGKSKSFGKSFEHVVESTEFLVNLYEKFGPEILVEK